MPSAQGTRLNKGTIMARYTKTVVFNYVQELDNLPIGQWVQCGAYGAKGQYMGTTFGNTDVIRWGRFSKANAKRNKLQRDYAKRHGAK